MCPVILYECNQEHFFLILWKFILEKKIFLILLINLGQKHILTNLPQGYVSMRRVKLSFVIAPTSSLSLHIPQLPLLHIDMLPNKVCLSTQHLFTETYSGWGTVPGPEDIMNKNVVPGPLGKLTSIHSFIHSTNIFKFDYVPQQILLNLTMC